MQKLDVDLEAAARVDPVARGLASVRGGGGHHGGKGMGPDWAGRPPRGSDI